MLWNETHLKSLNWKLFWNFHVYFTELFLLVRLTVGNFTNYISPWFWFHLWKISFLPGKCSLVGVLERTISPPAQHPDESSPSRTSFSPPTHKNTISSRQAVNSFSLLMTQSTVDSAALILLTCIPHVPYSNGSQGSSVCKMTIDCAMDEQGIILRLRAEERDSSPLRSVGPAPNRTQPLF
jgi:hypothetical protein